MFDNGIYAGVSTAGQDPQSQVRELREFAEDRYNESKVPGYADIIS